MPDYDGLTTHIGAAEREIKLAREQLVPINSIRQIEAWVLGHLNAATVVLSAARDAITQAKEAQAKDKKPKAES